MAPVNGGVDARRLGAGQPARACRNATRKGGEVNMGKLVNDHTVVWLAVESLGNRMLLL